MFTWSRSLHGSARDAILVVARALLAWLFIHEGVVLATNLDGTFAAMSRLGVPPPLALATIALQLGAGLAILLGWQTRAAALALGLFCLATALMFHSNLASRNELLHFEKDLAIAGGLFGLLAWGPGRWSVGSWYRSRKSLPPTAVGGNPSGTVVPS